MYIRLRKARHRSCVVSLLLFVGCPSLLYVVVGAHPIRIYQTFFYMCVSTRGSYTHSSFVQLLLTILSLYQVDVQTKHARNEKHFNSTKRNNVQGRIEAIYFYWYYNMRSSPADIEQNKRSRVYHRKMQSFSNYLPFGNDANFRNYPDAADVVIRYNRSNKISSSNYNIFATYPSSRSASIRVHVELPNG